MVLGTSSGAGKSWIATALCAWYRAQGYTVAPFKAQNMSNNARIVATPHGDNSWGEIGTAQYLQALAAGRWPDVRMNPLLLKPEGHARSQVILLGQHNPTLSALPWRERAPHVWPTIAASLDALRQENDVLIIEGAGSPAEINLYDTDVVNLRIARHAQAHCLLVADIDRGGAFAHLYGTWALLPAPERAHIKGFVLNKFRGDPRLLAPAPRMLQQQTGIPTVAVVPMQPNHGLPEEDSLFNDQGSNGHGQPVRATVAIVCGPHASNLDEFAALLQLPGVRVIWVCHPGQLASLHAHTDWLVLPGSKATLADLYWLRTQRLDDAITQFAHTGGRVLGICGGLQMLGTTLADPLGMEGPAQPTPVAGLGLLPLATTFTPRKTLGRARITLPALHGPWATATGVQAEVYEIHCGQTNCIPINANPASATIREIVPNLAWQSTSGNIWAIYWHGLLENPAVLQACFATEAPPMQALFSRMAQDVSQWFSLDCEEE